LCEAGGLRDRQPQLRITKMGRHDGARLLVGARTISWVRFGPDTDLRRYGLRLSERGGKNAKKRQWWRWRESWRYCCTVVVSGEVYEPLRHTPPEAKQEGPPIVRALNFYVNLPTNGKLSYGISTSAARASIMTCAEELESDEAAITFAVTLSADLLRSACSSVGCTARTPMAQRRACGSL